MPLPPPTIIVILDDSDGIYYWGYEYPDGKTDYIYGEKRRKVPGNRHRASGEDKSGERELGDFHGRRQDVDRHGHAFERCG